MFFSHEQGGRGISRRRGVPIVIFLLIVAVVAIKVQVYVRQFFEDKELGNPLPVASVHDDSPDLGHILSDDPVPTVTSASNIQHPTKPSSVQHLETSAYLGHLPDTSLPTPSRPAPPPQPPHATPFAPFRPLRPNSQSRRMQYFKSERFKAPNISISTLLADASPGLLFCNPSTFNPSDTGPMIMTDSNELVWRGPTGYGTNTRVQTVHGVPRLTYWQTRTRITQGHGYGAVHILDDSYQELYKICPQDLDIAFTNPKYKQECVLDMHVSLITDRGTLLATAYNVTVRDLSIVNGPREGWVYDAIFYEIDIETQQVLFRWRSLDHLDEIPYSWTKMPSFPNKTEEDDGKDEQDEDKGKDGQDENKGKDGQDETKEKDGQDENKEKEKEKEKPPPRPARRPGMSRRTPWDYFHINSVQLVDDGYIINSRAMWSVFKIKADGAVDWRLQGEHGGNFTLEDDIFFSWQHDARVVSSNATTVQVNLFNNDNSGFQKRQNASNFQSLSLDLESKRASMLRKLEDPTDKLYAMAMGNWQGLPNDHIMVSYGYGAGFKEFDDEGNVVFSAAFGAASFHSFSSSFSVFRLPWHAEPSWPPKVASESSEEEIEHPIDGAVNVTVTKVWMSWNGATDYDEWTLYTGHDEQSLNLVGTYAREGFETQVVLSGLHEWVQAEAWQEGKAIRKSDKGETTPEEVPVDSTTSQTQTVTATPTPAQTRTSSPPTTGNSAETLSQATGQPTNRWHY